MAIFKKDPSRTSGQDKKEEKVVGEKANTAKKPFTVSKKKRRRQTKKSNYYTHPDAVLLRPRITEKATTVIENHAYVFEVKEDATKHDVAHAIEHFYKVKPVKVNLARIPAKRRRSRNRRTFGVSTVGKKAYVYLKEGDTIEFI